MRWTPLWSPFSISRNWGTQVTQRAQGHWTRSGGSWDSNSRSLASYIKEESTQFRCWVYLCELWRKSLIFSDCEKSHNLYRAWYTSGTLIHGLLALSHFYLTINPWTTVFIPILKIHTNLRHRGETWFAHRLKSRQTDSTTSFSVFPGSKTREWRTWKRCHESTMK